MAPARQTTAVRFSLRGVFIAVAIVATYCAVLAPKLRGWSRPERVAFLTAWCAVLLGWMGVLAICSVRRLKAERSAGSVCLAMSVRRARAASLAWAIMVIALVVLITFQATASAASARLEGELVAMGKGLNAALSPWHVVPTGVLAGFLTAALWWRGDRVEFCDHGILSFWSYTPWPAVEREWQLSNPNLLMLRLGQQRRCIVVPEELRAEVNEMLRRRCTSLALPGEN